MLRRYFPEPRIWVPELRTRFHRKTEDVKLGRVGVRAGFGPKNGLEKKDPGPGLPAQNRRL